MKEQLEQLLQFEQPICGITITKLNVKENLKTTKVFKLLEESTILDHAKAKVVQK